MWPAFLVDYLPVNRALDSGKEPMRSSFGADWAFGIRGAIENTIRRAFPSDLRRWPILHAFNFEAYEVGAAHFIIILRDTFCGITTGPGVPKPFPHKDHPPVPPAPENIDQWLSYLIRKFDLRSDDVAMILPIHDSAGVMRQQTSRCLRPRKGNSRRISSI
jgi:hypothetical protein